MKRVLSFGLVALMISAVAHGADQTWTGEISSSNCGATHKKGVTARECTQQCVDGGSPYVFVSNGKVYKLAKQDDKQLRAHAGETVTLTGGVKGDIISASKIEAVTNAPAASRKQ